MKALSEFEKSEAFKNLKGWEFANNNELKKTYNLPDFAHAMIFVTSVGWLAESENRNRDVAYEMQWSQVKIRLQTRELKDLTENDFRLAERIDGLPHFIFI